jgi:hypothetical protein
MDFDLENIWEGICEEFEYFFSFDWLGDIGEFFQGFFEGMSEWSFAGTLYGIIMVVLVYLFRNKVFVLVHNIFLQIIFYIIAFIIGYLMGRKVWE